MIVKELDSSPNTQDVLAKAGHAAEEQMAFYLRRAFADCEQLWILNGLRLARPDDAAQLDHLIIHKYGMIVVESKSVTGHVTINDRAEWTRSYQGITRGMASPILQARRQSAFLMRYLEEHREALRDRRLFPRHHPSFLLMLYDVLVAISDSGIVKRPHPAAFDEVLKADRVALRISRMVDAHEHGAPRQRRGAGPRSTAGVTPFTAQEAARIADFLVRQHRPARSVVPADPLVHVQAAPVQPEKVRWRQTEDVPGCRHCRSCNVTVRSGPYGFYFKCVHCQGNTRINTTCAACGNHLAIRQNGIYYLADCQTCAVSALIFPQPSIDVDARTEGSAWGCESNSSVMTRRGPPRSSFRSPVNWTARRDEARIGPGRVPFRSKRRTGLMVGEHRAQCQPWRNFPPPDLRPTVPRTGLLRPR